MTESLLPILQSLLGIVLIPLFVWATGEGREIDVREIAPTVAVGLVLQTAIAAIFLKVPQASILFDAATDVIGARAVPAPASCSAISRAGRPPSMPHAHSTASSSPSRPCR